MVEKRGVCLRNKRKETGIISRSFSLESGMGIFRKAAAFMLLSYLSTQHRWLHHPEQTNDLS